MQRLRGHKRDATAGDPAAEAYKGLAPFYDELTRAHDYDAWTFHLERRARRSACAGSRLLDVACGTGKSFLPLLERGYRVTGCDISPEMLDQARAKAPRPSCSSRTCARSAGWASST